MVLPKIPGVLVDPLYEKEKIRQVAELMNVKHYRFPGAQPVSFSKEHFSELENENYFVSEKADGIRCLLFTTKNKNDNRTIETFLIDRKNKYYYIENLKFPEPGDNTFTKFQNNTIIDGELVLDEFEDGKQKLRFLIFDLVAFNGTSIIQKPYNKRLGYLRTYILDPYYRYLNHNPEYKKEEIFTIELKKLHLSYHMDDVFKEQQTLFHKSDGLLFTSEKAPYITGNCDKMLKWKPSQENTIDFKLQYIKSEDIYSLNIWTSENTHVKFAELTIDDPEMKKEWDKKPPEGRIAECYYENKKWYFMRFRDDKENANHISVVKRIMKSINDNVKKEELLSHSKTIGEQWKKRAYMQQHQQHQQHQQYQQQQQHHQQNNYQHMQYQSQIKQQPQQQYHQSQYQQNKTKESKNENVQNSSEYKLKIYEEMVNDEKKQNQNNDDNDNDEEKNINSKRKIENITDDDEKSDYEDKKKTKTY